MEKQKSNKELFASYFDNIYENKVIYHERHTIVARLENIKINEEYFSAIVIPQIHILKGTKSDLYFKKFKKSWEISCDWEYTNKIENGFGVYSGWLIWTEPDLVKKIEKLALRKKYREALELSILRC